MTRHGFALADIRGLTIAEVESYLDLLADMAAGKTGGGKTYVNRRLLRKKRKRGT